MADTFREVLARLDERSESMCERVDEIKDNVKILVARAEDHEIRLTKLEVVGPSRPKSSLWGALGGFIGGLVSGFLGGKASGG